MAQAVASMAGLRGTSQAVLEGSLQLNSSNRLSVAGTSRVALRRSGLTVRAQKVSSESEVVAQSSRRAILGLVAAGLATGSFVQVVLAEARSIKVGPPPPPSGGLPGTENSDEARDFDLPLKNRFYIQPLPPTAAALRAKGAGYLRYDLNTIISSKSKDEKKILKDLTGKLFQNIDSLDYAAKKKSSSDAQKSFAATVSTLNDVLAKIG
ncbi:hypothetical protein IFM89_008715 [Coptis chinensis]|uniref:Uncharacterized protein n=1 Tax=Coptis chinensis TaxID=261450 RepID=A0A835H054_9MAGN|nr:hypothetical protein IFM89_008715 [Coptis chinensis]